MGQEETKTLSYVKCPKCRSRMWNTSRRRYYCKHCKKHYKIVIEVIKTKLVPD